jgi:hypothetical protein
LIVRRVFLSRSHPVSILECACEGGRRREQVDGV